MVSNLQFGIQVFQTKKKALIWSGVANGITKLIIGARSSLFLPFKKLGMIIVDEEHDQSFKQDEGITYNARDMAISRAAFENIPINLITAVPSIETFENIKKGKYEVSRLNERYQNAALPNYEIINLNNTKLCLLYTSPSPRDGLLSRMPSSA